MRDKMEKLAVFLSLAVISIWSAIPVESQERPVGICAIQGCNCTVRNITKIFVKCIFNNNQDVEIAEGVIPEDTMEVEVSHCRELRIQNGAFNGGKQLKKVHVSGISTLVANRQAFQNITAINPLFEVSDCNKVVLESYAFKNTKGPLSISIARCRHVTIKSNTFSWLQQMTIREVPNLQLASNAFKFDNGVMSKITFHSVKILELPPSTFPSTAAEILMNDVWIRKIEKDAFCAINIFSLVISNASIAEIESGAFHERTLFNSLEFADIRLKDVRTGAFQAGVDNFTIQYSSLSEIEPGAINIAVASVKFNNNEFRNLRTNSMTFRQWNRIAIDNNLFQLLEANAISIASDAPKASAFQFSFSANQITQAEPKSLSFIEISQSVNSARVGSNYFKKTCNCNLESWVRDIIGSNTSVSWIMDTSYCVVDKILRNCFSIPEGYLGTRNYTQTVCSRSDRINCPKPQSKTQQSSAVPPSVGPHYYPRQKGYFNVDMSDFDSMEREKRIIVIVCVSVVFCIIVVILTSGILYVRRRVGQKLTPTSVADDESPDTDTNATERSEMVMAGENKATQTLPEELTEDYLEELKERLQDPEHYTYARNMIEHLYDLIKVEESCNNNNGSPVDRSRQKVRMATTKPSSVTIGTRAPSLDKLLPNIINPRPQIAEYAQPHDRRIIDHNHVYTELPGDEALATLAARAPLPLPPDVLIDNRIQYNENAKDNDKRRSFFKTLMGNSKDTNSLLDEYNADSPHSADHLYSELPDVSQTVPSKIMINRPLPTKPDHEE